MKLNTILGTLVLGVSLYTPSFAGGGLLDRMLGMKGSGCDSVCCDTGCAADPSCGCEIACEPACDTGRGCGLFGKKSCGPSCGPTCGCEISSCDPCASAAPTCGCEIAACDPCASMAPSCGCEVSACDPCGCDTGCSKPRRRPLMELLGKFEAKKHALFAGMQSCDSGCAPSCGCEMAACDPCAAPTCGCEMNTCAAPTCGCEMNACAAPTCGCEIAACDPCASSCDSGCGKKGGGLLSKLFQRKNKSCCDAGCDSSYVTSGCATGGCSSCSSGSSYSGGMSPMSAPVAAPAVHGDAAPMPPAPIVDPSAYLQSNRRVIQATSYVR